MIYIKNKQTNDNYEIVSGGLYAKYSRNSVRNYSFTGEVYYAYGNNSNKKGADNKTSSMVSAELWLPMLGNYGHFSFGNTYDVSNEGIAKAQRKKLEDILDLSNQEYADILNEIKKNNLSVNQLNKLEKMLLNNSFERVFRFGQHEQGSEKRTYREKDSWSYGNIELIVRKDGYAYSSYNYGNNFITHFFIDYLGWKGRGY